MSLHTNEEKKENQQVLAVVAWLGHSRPLYVIGVPNTVTGECPFSICLLLQKKENKNGIWTSGIGTCNKSWGLN